jgi:hypothetical protein
MHDIDAIEAINFEQLATVTDRLLLRGRVTRRRLSTNKILVRPEAFARGTLPHIPPATAATATAAAKPVRFPTSLAVLTGLTAIAASLATML